MVPEFTVGDVPANPIEKSGYILEFQDEFEGTTLDLTKWLPYYLSHWSSRERSAPQYTFENSKLVLQITKEQEPWCPEFDGEVRCSSIQTGAFAGSVGSRIGQHRFNPRCVVREAQANVQLYTPHYGYFELRAKGITTGGNLAALWLIGYEDSPEKSAEITMFEIVGVRAGETASTIGYGVRQWADPAMQNEFYEEPFPINAARFHIYGMEWTPTHIDFYLDNHKIKTIYQSPSYPMQFMLNLYEFRYDTDFTGRYDPTDAYPKRFEIDYLRGYQPIGGY